MKPILQFRRLGMVFDVRKLAPEPMYYAQAPQLLATGDAIRIYFSTRVPDDSGLPVSVVRFVDFDAEHFTIKNISTKAVVGPAAAGAFDEHGIFPFNPVRAGNRLLAYTCGWSRRVHVPVETATGLCESFDEGNTFSRCFPGPVLSKTLQEPFLVGDSFVLNHHGRFFMWYIFGTQWLPPAEDEPVARVYKIAFADSEDGISWKRSSKALLPDVLGEFECQALPSVIIIDGVFHMVFCFREATGFRNNPSRSYRLGYARSYDGENWYRDDRLLSISGFETGIDDEMQCYPNWNLTDDGVLLLYNGNSFGKNGFLAAECDTSYFKKEPVRYTENEADLSAFYAHLHASNSSYTPPLSTYSTIGEYAAKLIEHSHRIEAWTGDVLAGNVSVYLNRLESGAAYISNVSVLPGLQGLGIATNLLRLCAEKASQAGFNGLKLEVFPENQKAIQRYKSNGFEIERTVGGKIIMQKSIN